MKTFIFILLIFIALFVIAMTGPKSYTPGLYIYNAGSAPSLHWNPKIFIGTATTNSSGIATFQATNDGTSGGVAIFNNIYSMHATAQLNTSDIADIPVSSIQAITNGKTITVNVVESNTTVLTGQGLEIESAGTTVNLIIIGE